MFTIQALERDNDRKMIVQHHVAGANDADYDDYYDDYYDDDDDGSIALFKACASLESLNAGSIEHKHFARVGAALL